jgi:hypothetical protein
MMLSKLLYDSGRCCYAAQPAHFELQPSAVQREGLVTFISRELLFSIDKSLLR